MRAASESRHAGKKTASRQGQNLPASRHRTVPRHDDRNPLQIDRSPTYGTVIPGPGKWQSGVQLGGYRTLRLHCMSRSVTVVAACPVTAEPGGSGCVGIEPHGAEVVSCGQVHVGVQGGGQAGVGSVARRQSAEAGSLPVPVTARGRPEQAAPAPQQSPDRELGPGATAAVLATAFPWSAKIVARVHIGQGLGRGGRIGTDPADPCAYRPETLDSSCAVTSVAGRALRNRHGQDVEPLAGS